MKEDKDRYYTYKLVFGTMVLSVAAGFGLAWGVELWIQVDKFMKVLVRGLM